MKVGGCRRIQTIVNLSQTWNPNGRMDNHKFITEQLEAIRGVFSIQKMPCHITYNGGLVETYHYRIWHLPLPSIFKTIQSVVDYHRLIGKRYVSRRHYTSVERFKTGAHFYVQFIASDCPKNWIILEQTCDIWRLCGWQNIHINAAGCWISARASRKRIKTNFDQFKLV